MYVCMHVCMYACSMHVVCMYACVHIQVCPHIYIYILGFASNRKTYGFFRLVQSMQSFSQYAVAKPQINSEL